jgi:hypothetical protein
MKAKLDAKLFPDARVVRQRNGKEALVLDVQTSLETSIESLKNLGLVFIGLGFLIALVWLSGGMVLTVLAFIFYLFFSFVHKKAACYYIIETDKKTIIYHVELPFWQRDFDYLKFSDFNCIGVRTDWETTRQLRPGKRALFANRSDYRTVYKWKYQLVGVTKKGKTIELGLWKDGIYTQLNLLAENVAEILNTRCCMAKKDFVNRVKKTNDGYMLVNRHFNWLTDSINGKTIIFVGISFAISAIWAILDTLAGALGLK